MHDNEPFHGDIPMEPEGVDERGVPAQSPREESVPPTRDPRVSAIQRLKAIREMVAFLAQEVDSLGALMVGWVNGEPRNHHQRDGQPRPEKRIAPLTVEEAQAQARKAARAYTKARDQRRD